MTFLLCRDSVLALCAMLCDCMRVRVWFGLFVCRIVFAPQCQKLRGDLSATEAEMDLLKVH
jgi:hypothetical protein